MAKRRTRVHTVREGVPSYTKIFNAAEIHDPSFVATNEDAVPRTLPRTACHVEIPIEDEGSQSVSFHLRDALTKPKRDALRALHAEIEEYAESLAGFAEEP